MDELKKKWNKALNFGLRPKAFKGHGQKLGTGEAKSAVDQQRAVRPASHATLRSGSPAAGPSRPPQPAASSDSAGPSRPVAFAGTGRTLGGSGAASAAPTASSTQPSAPPLPVTLETATSQHPPANNTNSRDARDRAEHSLQSSSGAYEPPSEEVEAAVSLLRTEPHGGAAATLLAKVIENILKYPEDPKYRRLRMQNKKIKEDIMDVSGGLEFLQAAGFQLVFEEDAASGQTEGYAVFPEDEQLSQLQSALQGLGPVAAASQPATPQPAPPSNYDNSASPEANSSSKAAAGNGVRQSPTAATPAAGAAAATSRLPSEPRERQTQVLLPDNPATEVSDEIFKRTPAEVKAEYLAARKKQELGQMLMTREYRAKLMSGVASKGKTPAYGTIRVRMPDGLVLQGEFNAGEQVANIFGWVTELLRDPSRQFELISPARRPLMPNQGSLRSADLLPSSVLNFRWLQAHQADTYLPALRDDLLAQAKSSVT